MFEQDKYEGKHSAEPSTDRDAEPNSQDKPASILRELVLDVLIALLLAAVCLYFVRPSIVKQSSMENTLHENDYLIMSRQAYRTGEPERGDIIIFKSTLVDENGDYKRLIKRAIGLPGDELKIVESQLYINGEKYDEDYLKDGITPAGDVFAEGEAYIVPEGYIFAMGDNRVFSEDSRSSLVGPISMDLIEGKVVLRLFPFSKIQRF